MVGLDNPIHLLFLLVILLLLFGAKRLPEMGRSLGSGLRGFKESISGEAPSEPVPAITAAKAEAADGLPPDDSTPERDEARQAV